MVGFSGGRKTGEPGKKPPESQQPTHPTYVQNKCSPVQILACSHPPVGTPYNGLYSEAPPEKALTTASALTTAPTLLQNKCSPVHMILACPHPPVGTPFSGLYSEDPPEKGTFPRF